MMSSSHMYSSRPFRRMTSCCKAITKSCSCEPVIDSPKLGSAWNIIISPRYPCHYVTLYSYSVFTARQARTYTRRSGQDEVTAQTFQLRHVKFHAIDDITQTVSSRPSCRAVALAADIQCSPLCDPGVEC